MLQQSFVTQIADINTIQYDRLGAIRVEGDKLYKYVKFTGTNAAAAGDTVCYTDNTLTAVDKANASVGAGVVQGAVAAGSVQYGWIQIQGRCVINTLTSGANGNSLTSTGAGAGALIVAAAVTNQIVAVCVDSVNKVVDLEYPW